MSRGLAASGLACLRGERLLFAGLGFAAPPGAAVLLVGPNGSGKSSLLRLLAGLARPLAGTIAWEGAPLAREPEAAAAARHLLAAQDPIKPGLTVADNLAWTVALAGGRADGRTQADALERAGLGPLARLPGRALSTGQRRRLSLARLIAAPRPLWLLDEPTAPLDAAGQSLFAALAAAHRAEGGVIVAATHLDLGLPDAASLAPGDWRPEG